METPDEVRLQQSLSRGDSGITVVVFSQVRVPPGKFGLEQLFRATRHSCLFLNDTEYRWYLGLDAQIDAALDLALESETPKRLIYYGSSMGGYAALRTALRRQDGEVHAFGAEIELGHPGAQSSDYLQIGDASVASSLGGCSVSLQERMNLYYGCLDPVDAANAVRSHNLWPQAQLHCLNSTHGNHDHLYSLNLIRRITRTFERSAAAELKSKALPLSPDFDGLEAFGSLFETLSTGQAIDPASIEALSTYKTNPGMMRLKADALADQGLFADAITELHRAETLISSNPVLQTLPKRWRKELPLREVQWLMDFGANDEARALLAETAAHFSADTAMRELATKLGVSLAVDPAPSPAPER
ncbi:MAG: hypothetical protein HWE23_07180 [Rhodobacteraceae bacterium]|nr:hypothetical protein [Paracoccaceae bacterium]